MSGLCPFAVQKIIAPGSNDPAIKPRAVILHVDAGNAESLEDYFRNRSGGIESHFFIRAGGGIEQYRDIYRQADANLDANDFAVSIETQGYGPGEWSLQQLASIKRLLTWLHTEAGIPLRKIQHWDGSGIGYHTQFGAPGHWTPVAKTCPGPNRIKQFDSVLVPWMTEASRRKPKTPAPPFGVATFNMGNASTLAVARDLARIAKHARAIGLQEAGDRSAAFRLFLATHRRWAIYRPTDQPGAASVPILYKRSVFRLRKATTVTAVPERDVVPAGKKKVGAGPGTIKAKVINHLELVERKSGQVVHVLNTHLLPSATRNDMSAEETRLRREHYAEHIAALVKLIKSLDGPVIVTGDFNAERHFGLLAPLAELVTGWTVDDTHGNHAIDNVLHRGIKAGHAETLETSSDHHAVIAVIHPKEHR